MTTILGIETSCDETSAAVVRDGAFVLSNVVASQFDLHSKYGGVVPEIAARAHIERLDFVVEEAMAIAGVSKADLDAIAVTCRPGLVGALLVGVTFAKGLSWAWGKPLIAVDHIHAHAYSAALGSESLPWPAVALVVSGGHTSLFHVTSPTCIHLLGATLDDAAGEAFDKVASILGLGFPGGPAVEKCATGGDSHSYEFPRSMLSKDSLDFSFSGIKTAVLYQVHGPGKTQGGLEQLSAKDLSNIAASFQEAVVDVLAKKTMAAVRQTGGMSIVVGGGVAANKALRSRLEADCLRNEIQFAAAPLRYCTDNAAMIAGLAYHQLRSGNLSDLSFDAFPSSVVGQSSSG